VPLLGTYDFGTIDSSKYTGSITYTNVNTANGFWEFTGSGYAVGTGAFHSSSIDAMYVSISRHNSLLIYLFLPVPILELLYSLFPTQSSLPITARSLEPHCTSSSECSGVYKKFNAKTLVTPPKAATPSPARLPSRTLPSALAPTLQLSPANTSNFPQQAAQNALVACNPTLGLAFPSMETSSSRVNLSSLMVLVRAWASPRSQHRWLHRAI
jgi:Eukaryotic aspartyl protease